MYQRLLLLLSALTSLLVLGRTQSAPPVCGTVGALQEEIVERLARNQQALATAPSALRNTLYVPVTFHLVGRDDGVGQVSPGKVLDMLCALNEDFSPVDIQFYLHQMTQLTNTSIYSDHTNADALMLALRDNESVNVWLVQDATPDQDILESGIVQGYYTSGDLLRDWIVMRNSVVSAEATTLTHEMGHFFSILHPFRGWDNEPYDPDIHGVPAPSVSPGGPATERMSGANCETAADRLCDTPPDYNSGFGWSNCDYEGALDPDGVPIDPEEKLFMSYFDDCPRDQYFFSPSQQDLMRQDLLSSQRNYLQENASAPGPALSMSPPSQLLPAPQSTVANVPGVTFEWTAVPGADRYLLEIDIAQNYSTPLGRRILVDGTSRTVASLQTGRTYYWRVRAFSDFQPCSDYSLSAVFYTGEVTATRAIDFVTNWSVYPNPVRRGTPALLRLETTRPFDADLRIFDAYGREVRNLGPRKFISGTNQIPLAWEGLPPGVYGVVLHTAGGQLTQRMVLW